MMRPVRELRSSLHNRLHVQIARTVFGSCAFCHAAPAVWNGLPPDLTDCLTSLTSFKRRLKTLFCSQLFRRWSRYWSASAIRRYFHNFVDIGRVTNCVLLVTATSIAGAVIYVIGCYSYWFAAAMLLGESIQLAVILIITSSASSYFSAHVFWGSIVTRNC